HPLTRTIRGGPRRRRAAPALGRDPEGGRHAEEAPRKADRGVRRERRPRCRGGSPARGTGLHEGREPAGRPRRLARREPAGHAGREVTAPKVVMYAAGWCPYCARARQLLAAKGVAFEEIDVDATGREEMI